MSSASMSVDTATVPTGQSDGPFRLTPFLNNTPQGLFSPSPWMVIDFDSLSKGSSVTPANLTPEGRQLLEQQGCGHTSTQLTAKDAMRMAERNKFEKSFGMALVTGESPSRSSASKPKDAEVPDMNDGAGPALPMVTQTNRVRSTTDQNVPQSSSQAVNKRKDLTGKRNGGADSPDGEGRKAKRREQNRRNAAKCRQRKIDRVNELSEQLDVLKHENMTLKQSHAALAKKLAALTR